MEFNEQNFTERQVEIIKKVGSEYRENVPKDHRTFIIIFSLLQVLFVGLAIGYYLYTKTYLFSIILLALVLYDVLVVFSKRNNFYNGLKNADDYKVGCYAINKDKRIVGYADRKVANYKKTTKYIGIGGLVIGGIMFYNVYSTSLIDTSSLKTQTGYITNIEANTTYTYNDSSYTINYYKITIQVPSSSDVTVMETLQGNYIVYGCYSYLTDSVDTIKTNINDVTANNEITISYDDKYFESYGFYDIYDLKIGNSSYISVDTINESINKTKKTYTYVAIAALALGVLVFASGYGYNAIFYTKMKENESIDINYSDYEKNQINEKLAKEKEEKIKAHEEKVNSISSEKLEDLKNVSIKTKSSSNAYLFKAIIIACGIGAVIYSFLKAEETYKTYIIIFGAIIALYGVVGIFDTLTSYELLEGNTLQVKRFFKVQTIDISNVTSIAMQGSTYILLDIDGKQVATISYSKFNAKAIVDNLVSRGVDASFYSNNQTSFNSNQTTDYDAKVNDEVIDVEATPIENTITEEVENQTEEVVEETKEEEENKDE